MTAVRTSKEQSRPKPLDGVRILSLAEQFPGPYATLVLADLGADVLLVERPNGGDPSRQFAGFFAGLNRNKRSLAIDLKDARMKDALNRLIRDADVLVEGFRPGTIDRLGFGYDAVSAVNDRIVFVSISGFGQSGPYRDRPAHDLSYQALAGMLRERGDGYDVPHMQVADLAAGMYGVVAVLLGLYMRERSCTGSFVDASMFDVLISMMTSQLAPTMNGSVEFGPIEPGYGVYRTADGAHLSVSVAHEDYFWRNLCAAVDLDDYADLSSGERVRVRGRLEESLAAAFAARPLAEWAQRLERADVPFAPVLDLEQVPNDPQVKARAMIVQLFNGVGSDRHVSQPLVVDGQRPGPTRGVPALGENSVDVLSELGHTAAEIEQLIREGVVVDGACTYGAPEAVG